jgi:hypothetical protein
MRNPGSSSKVSAFAKNRLRFKQKEEWPDPELSAGEYLRSEPSLPEAQRFWSVVGPARELWATRLGPQISKFIQEVPLLQYEVLVADIYMVGTQVETASPTIIINCSDKIAQREIAKLFRKSRILDQYPGVKFACNVQSARHL